MTIYTVRLEIENEEGDYGSARRVSNKTPAAALQDVILNLTERYPNDQGMQAIGKAVKAVRW